MEPISSARSRTCHFKSRGSTRNPNSGLNSLESPLPRRPFDLRTRGNVLSSTHLVLNRYCCLSNWKDGYSASLSLWLPRREELQREQFCGRFQSWDDLRWFPASDENPRKILWSDFQGEPVRLPRVCSSLFIPVKQPSSHASLVVACLCIHSGGTRLTPQN